MQGCWLRLSNRGCFLIGPAISWRFPYFWNKQTRRSARYPAEFLSPSGITVQILARDRAHKWFGNMISTHTDGSHGLDLEHHLKAASRTFDANKSILCDKCVSISQRCYGYTCCMFCTYKPDLCKLDIQFRKLVHLWVLLAV